MSSGPSPRGNDKHAQPLNRSRFQSSPVQSPSNCAPRVWGGTRPDPSQAATSALCLNRDRDGALALRGCWRGISRCAR